MNEIDMTEFIPTGYKNGLTRMDLRIITGMRDRQVRRSIEWTSDNVEPIYSYDGKYFRVRDKKDLVYAEAYVRREKGKAKALAKRARASEKFLEDFAFNVG